MENISDNEAQKPGEQTYKELKCPKCGAGVVETDTFCGECGNKVKESERSGTEKFWSDEVTANVTRASKWVLALGVMFIIFGTIFGFMQKKTTDQALSNLTEYEDSATWSEPVRGKTVTVGELRRMIYFEYYSLFVLNYFLAVVMFIIYKWSKTSPFSAFVTALSIYAGVIVLNAVLEPATIIQGVIIKILVIAALINGIKAAIPTRGAIRASA